MNTCTDIILPTKLVPFTKEKDTKEGYNAVRKLYVETAMLLMDAGL